MAATFLSEGDFDAAARLYLEAKQYAPDDEQALANEALGHHLLRDSFRAFDLATDLLARFPSSVRVLSVWVNAAPATVDVLSLAARIPPHLKDHGEIALALAYHAFSQEDLAKAEEMARKATQTIGDHPPAWLLLGQILERKELSRLESLALDPLHDFDNSVAREAESYVSRAIALAIPQKSPVLTDAYLVRAEVRQVLADSQGRETDLETAHSIAPDRPGVMKGYAGLLVSRGELDRAIDVLRTLNRTSQEPSAKLLLASTLRDRSVSGDTEEAAALFRDVAGAKTTAVGLRRVALSLAVDCLLKLNRALEAEQLLLEYSPALVGELFRTATAAKLYIDSGNIDRANQEAAKARELMRAGADPEEKRLVADVFLSLGRFEEAYPLCRSLYVPGIWNISAMKLLNCISRLGRDKEALELCGELRESGVKDSSLREYELSLLEKYDVGKAIALLQGRLREEPDDRVSRLRLSLLGVQFDRQDLIDADPRGLPSVDTATAHIGRGVVQVLQLGGRPNEALIYAYDLLRRHFESPEAHLAYISTLAPLGPQPKVTQPEQVGPGVAVCYREHEHFDDVWVVVEDSNNPELSRDEYAVRHPLVQRMLGKKPGEDFVLAEGTVQNRMASVRRVMSKFVFRFQDCMNRWQVRFPASAGIESVTVIKHVNGQEEHDFSAMKRFADLRHERRQHVVEQYRSSIMPLHAFGADFGLSVFDAVGAVAQDSELDLRCCNGSEEEKAGSLAALQAAGSIVLDATSIATLGMLDCPELLAGWPHEIIVSLATINALREEVADLAKQPEPSGYIGRQGSKYVMTKEDPESRRRRVEKLRKFIAAIEARCRIEPCTEVAALPAEQRKMLIEVLGHHGIESILLAKVSNSVLWTDDWVVGGFGSWRVCPSSSLDAGGPRLVIGQTIARPGGVSKSQC